MLRPPPPRPSPLTTPERISAQNTEAGHGVFRPETKTTAKKVKATKKHHNSVLSLIKNGDESWHERIAEKALHDA